MMGINIGEIEDERGEKNRKKEGETKKDSKKRTMNKLLKKKTKYEMNATIDLVVAKLENQIKKYKTKINRKFRQEGSPKYVFAELEKEKREQEIEEEESSDIEIVRTKRFDLKPMDSEEAV